MEETLKQFMEAQPLILLMGIICVCIYLLGKGADMLVDEAVALSVRSGVPKVLIGATIVSLGTTLPEAAVSVFAAMSGNPSLALGNAVGSIICDTGLILGIATVMSPLPLNRKIVNRQGWIQLGAGFFLVLSCLPYTSLTTVFKDGGRLAQPMGWLFLVLLVIYIWRSIKWAREDDGSDMVEGLEIHEEKAGTVVVLLKLVFAIALVVVSSRILIPAVEEVALRFHVPDAIIAATLVAFGTSLPELVTAITAVRKGHGELAVGNIIGADILNVLFVAGAASAVTSGGLAATPHFFYFLFPAMLFVLVVFRIGIFVSGDKLKRPFGFVLLATYLGVTVISLALGQSVH